MNHLDYSIGDATAPTAVGNKVICHVCNDIGGWGAGFVLALSKKWSQPEAANREWYRNRAQNDFGLGAVQFVQVEPDVWVANVIAQHGIQRKGITPRDGLPPIRYEAVEAGLRRVAEDAKRLNASVHMPRIGCGLAGGRWEQIEPIIRQSLCLAGIAVFVYDLP